MKAEEWFEQHGGIQIATNNPPSLEAQQAYGAKYPGAVLIEQVGKVVTLEQAKQYAREFAAEQLKEAAEAYDRFSHVKAWNIGCFLRTRAEELLKD